MKKIWGVLTIFAVMFAVAATTASAQMYVSGNLGAVMVSDADVSDSFFGGTIGEISFDTGPGLTLGIGNAYGNNFRSEVELGYRINDLDKVTGKGIFSGAGSQPLNGDISSLSLMANGYYDLPAGGAITPFVGAGIGFSRLSVDSSFAEIDDTDTVFAYQVAAGVSIAINPRMNFDVQYRYFATSDPDFTDDFGDKIEIEYAAHNFLLGLRYSF